MAVGKHEQETMVEQEENVLTCQFQTGEPQKVPDDAADGKPISVVAKLRTVVHRHRFPPMVKSFTFSDAVNWMRHGGPWRGYLIAAVSLSPLAKAYFILYFILLIFSELFLVQLFFMERMSSILSVSETNKYFDVFNTARASFRAWWLSNPASPLKFLRALLWRR